MNIETLKALADETRLAIVRQLAGGERCVCQIASELGISDALVSHHIKRLREAGVVRSRRVGVWLHCSLEPGVLGGVASELGELEGAAAASQARGSCCGSAREVRQLGREGA